MIGIIPTPALHSFVIVQTNPAQGFNVRLTNFTFKLNKVERSDSELLNVKLLFESVNIVREL